MLNKICTMAAKTRAIPFLPAGRQGLHRDSFLAKVPGPCPVLASGNYIPAGWLLAIPTYHVGTLRSALHIAGPLCVMN